MGDKYITVLTEKQARNLTDVVHSINDVRNGLTLNTLTRTHLGHVSVAFLKVPNFAIQRADIDPPLSDHIPDGYVAHTFIELTEAPFANRPPGSLLPTP
ncbi:hypothetical protein QCA50_005863 [Cerrena zonata]|uniref:Uncharacterized protein n=1 Tax=Cerrena zonata TaxID=2478898 RepID=A0AAW0GGB1_9APHY